VNEYPQVRGFKAIGSGGEEFPQDMIRLVERVLGVTVPTTQVSVQPSSKGTCKQPSHHSDSFDSLLAIWVEPSPLQLPSLVCGGQRSPDAPVRPRWRRSLRIIPSDRSSGKGDVSYR